MIRLLRKLFIHDWPLKLFSLALAVLTWLAIHFSQRQRVVPVPGTPSLSAKTYFDLPVTIISRNKDVSRFQADPAEVDVTVQGNETVLEELPRTGIRVIVDLSDTILNSPRQMPVEVITPPGITYVRIAPEDLVQVTPPTPPKNQNPPKNSE